MLVFSRKPGEVIVLPQCEITITVIDIQPTRVRLGINAPLDVNIYREEIWRRICEEGDLPPGDIPKAQTD
jgi:carbon storage regulator